MCIYIYIHIYICILTPTWKESCMLFDVHQHGNDSFFYIAVEPDSLIAIFWHFFIIFVIRGAFSQTFQSKLGGS